MVANLGITRFTMALAGIALAVLSPAQPSAIAADPPATVEAATKVLSLATFPLIEAADEPTNRQLAGLTYQAKSDIQAAYAFQKKQLETAGFRELPDPTVTEQYASSLFNRDGFRIAVTVMPDYTTPGSGKVGITLQNLGNIPLGSLPVPDGATPLYDFPASIAWVTELTPEQATAKVRELVQAAGWEPYGEAGQVSFFRQNAVQLTAQIAAAPAQQSKTVITYSSVLLSAELPAPPDAVRIQYSDGIKQLSIDTESTAEQVVAFYRERMAPAGWQATTEQPVQDRFRSFMIFRNPTGDMLDMNFTEVDGIRRVNLRHQSVAEVEAETARAKALAAAAMAKRDQPKPKVAIKLPVGAKITEQSPRSIEFTVAANSGRARVTQMGKALAAAGWKEELSTLDPMAGVISLRNDQGSISIDYIDVGIGPAQISITGTLVDLEVAK